jgi:hypothetical protein
MDLRERYGLSKNPAIRLAKLRLNPEALAVLVNDAKRESALRQGLVPARGKYRGGLKALGMSKGKSGPKKPHVGSFKKAEPVCA